MILGMRARTPRPVRRRAGGRTTAACTAALAVLVAGCNTDAEGSDAQTLEDFFGFGTDQDELMAEAAAQQREVEESIAACMAQEGFEYVPPDVGDMMGPADHPMFELSEEEFRQEYGYGITTIDHAALGGAGDGMDDPNVAIQQEMDAAEREAYQQALHGEEMGIEADADLEEGAMPEIGGCQGEAIEEVQGDQMQVVEELLPDLMALEEQVDSDPRMVEALEGWRTCLRKDGFDFEERFDPQTHIAERFEQLQGSAFAAAEPDEVDPQDPPPEPDLDDDELDELRREELEIAAADWECAEEHLAETEAEVRTEVEGSFIDERRDDLERMRPDG